MILLDSSSSNCFKTWSAGSDPRWEVDWIAKFVEDPVVLHLEEGGDDGEEEEENEDSDAAGDSYVPSRTSGPGIPGADERPNGRNGTDMPGETDWKGRSAPARG